MKIKLLLFEADRTWRGITQINDSLFKVTLFPGKLNQPWEAVLMQGAFVELETDSVLSSAIERAYNDYIKLCHPLTQSEVDSIFELVESNPQLLEEIKEALKR